MTNFVFPYKIVFNIGVIFMNKVLLNLNAKYSSFGAAERKIADYISQNYQTVPSLFIGDLSELCGCSVASITRFSKKLGFDGFPQLKIALAKEKDFQPVSENVSSSDSAYEVFSKICTDIYSSLEKTKAVIDKNALEECCVKLLNAKKVFIFGLGNSSSVAQDAAHKLFRTGISAAAYTDNHLQMIAATHADSDTVVIGISHSGRSRDIVEAMKLAKANGAFTVSVTNREKSPIIKVSDCVLTTVSDETNYRILGLSSRIAALAIVDAVYSYIVCKSKSAGSFINEAESSLTCKKC